MREPRSDLADCSPSTHEMASAMFDLPQPFGPIMAAMPSPWNFSSVRSQNDLNPRICSFLSLSKVTPSLDRGPRTRLALAGVRCKLRGIGGLTTLSPRGSHNLMPSPKTGNATHALDQL